MSADQSIVGWGGISSSLAGRAFAPALDRFIFLRHGQTDGNAAGFYQPAHQPLNSRGELQAMTAAEQLAAHKIGRIIASPMPRAWKTANTVALHHRLEPEVEVAIQERIFLRLWGTPIGVLDWSADPPGCERLAAFVGRVTNAFERMLAEPSSGPDVLIVSHGGVLLVLAALLSLDPAGIPRANAVPLLIERSARGWRLGPLSSPI